MGGFKLTLASVGYDKDRDFLILYLNEPLRPNLPLRIRLVFLGEDHLSTISFFSALEIIATQTALVDPSAKIKYKINLSLFKLYTYRKDSFFQKYIVIAVVNL